MAWVSSSAADGAGEKEVRSRDLRDYIDQQVGGIDKLKVALKLSIKPTRL
jgi:hypothetical protein